MAAGKWLALACAAVASLGCVALSLILILKIGFLGFAIGGWTGLKEYEQSIVDARNTQKAAAIQLMLLQAAGGTFAFLVLRGKRGLAWLPVFVVGFSVATAILFWLYVVIGTALH